MGFGDLIVNELPCQKTCLQVKQNYAVKGLWKHIKWESFWNQHDEDNYTANYGDQPFNPVNLLITDGGVVKVDNSMRFDDQGRIHDWRSLWQALHLRLIAFSVMDACSRDCLAALHTIYEQQINTGKTKQRQRHT